MRIDHLGYAIRDIDKAKKPMAMEVMGYDFDVLIKKLIDVMECN